MSKPVLLLLFLALPVLAAPIMQFDPAEQDLGSISQLSQLVKQQLALGDTPLRAVWQGPGAAQLLADSRAQGPIYVQSRLLARLAGPDCGRILLRHTLLNTPNSAGQTVHLSHDMKLSLCRDGSAPDQAPSGSEP